MRHWKIDEQHVVTEVETWEEWLAWARLIEEWEPYQRLCIVGRTQVDTGVRVATDFMRGIDHSTMPSWDLPTHVPLLFETMVFGGPHDQAQWRYATWDEAAAGHAEAVALALGDAGHVTRDDGVKRLLDRVFRPTGPGATAGVKGGDAMTREEFELGYARRSQLTVKKLHELGLRAASCDCKQHGCPGWQMVHVKELEWAESKGILLPREAETLKEIRGDA